MNKLKHIDFLKSFNEDDILFDSFNDLVIKKNINIIIETGTYLGDTTLALANMISEDDTLHTFESNRKYFEQSYRNLNHLKNIRFHLGNSYDKFDLILPKLKEDAKIIAYLDAHWYTPCPTLYELKRFAKYKIKPEAIVIHDVKNPDDPNMKYDTYPDFTYTYENLEKSIIEVYGEGNFKYYYNKKANGANVGTLFLEKI